MKLKKIISVFKTNRLSFKKYILIFLLIYTTITLRVIFAYSQSSEHSSDSSVQSISFYCLNDFHAALWPVKAKWMQGEPLLGGAASLAGYIQQFRKKDPDMIWVIAGDIFLGDSIDNLTKGGTVIEFLNLIQPDCLALGNHEFDYGLTVLKKRVKEADFPIICANIKMKNNKYLVKPYIIHKTKRVKILFIGIICSNLYNIVSIRHLDDVRVLDPVETILEHSKKMDKEVNLTIIVSHSGLNQDKKIAEALPSDSGVDIIIGGHSHDLMENPDVVNGIIICQAGSKGHYLGNLNVDINTQTNKIISYSWHLIPILTKDIFPHQGVETWLKKTKRTIIPQINETIGRLQGDWTRNKDELEWAIANFATDAIAEKMDVDIGIYNRGGIRKSLTNPLIQVKDILEIFPFGNYLICFYLTGKQLKILLETHLSFKSEYLFFSKNLRYTFDRKKPLRNRLKGITIENKPLQENKFYTIATIEFLWDNAERCFGISQEEIKNNGGFKDYLNITDKYLFIKYIKEHQTINAIIDGRVNEVD